MDPVAVGQAGASADQAEAAQPPAPQEMSRRRFMRLLLGFSLISTVTMIVTPIIGFLIPKPSEGAGGGGKVLAAKSADLPAGTGKVVAMGSAPVIVVNNADAGVKAFSAVCTHLGCIVEYDETLRQIHCPCHDGRFNPASGAVVSGPPPQPLKPVNVAVEGDSIYLVAG
jgi:cytochrome b6-f complex iron-sulfur subunit